MDATASHARYNGTRPLLAGVSIDLMPSFEQGLFAILFVIPGYVMLKVASVTMAVDFGRSTVDLLLKCLMLSSVSYVFSSPILVWTSQLAWFKTPLGLLTTGVVVVMVVPTLLACSYIVLVLKKGLLRRLADWAKVPYNYPDPSAWDAAFRRLAERGHFVRVTLKSGYTVAGFFGHRSWVGTSPGSRDIFIELAYHVDEHGNLLGPMKGNTGVYIAQEEIAIVEFLRGGEESGRQPKAGQGPSG